MPFQSHEMEVSRDLFCDVHPSAMDYGKRKKCKAGTNMSLRGLSRLNDQSPAFIIGLKKNTRGWINRSESDK